MSEFRLPEAHPLHFKNILALDFGEKFIGLATYCVNRDPFPTPFGRLANTSHSKVIQELGAVISNESIDLVVIGVPRLLDGKETSTTKKARDFIELIGEHFSLPIREQDETLSTFEAQSRMKSSPRYNFQVDLKQIDAVAACVILEDFIRSKRDQADL
jgi:putative Holliday junction resolvase